MVHPMDRHPDIHAKLAKHELLQLAKAVEHFHVSIQDGAEILPEIPEEEREVHRDESYIEYLDRQHEPVWQRGPKAILGAVLIRAIPALVVVMGLYVASKHMGDPYLDVQMEEMFAMASRPAVQQGFLGRVFDPDRSDSFKHRFHAVRFMKGNRILMADGHYFAFEGLEDVRPMLRAARDNFTAPTVYAHSEGGKLRVREVQVAGQSFAANTTLNLLAKLSATNDEPERGAGGSEFMFANVALPPIEDSEAVDKLAGRRISVEGRLAVAADGGYLLQSGGSGFRLQPTGHGGLAQALEIFAAARDEVRLDVVLDPYPLRGEEPNRQGTRLLGDAEVYSMSISNFHIIARR
jgi:hypothetical protein